MPLDALGLALAAAVVHAGWNVLLHGSDDVEARTAAALALAVLVFAPVAAATWSVQLRAAPYIAASAVFEIAYFALLVAAYKRRDLSVVYPVARGSAPVLVLIGSAIVLGTSVSAGETVGVLLVASGVLLVRGVRRGASGLPIALTIGCTIAAYTLIDKQGLRHATPIPYLELTTAAVAVALCGSLLVRRGVPFRESHGIVAGLVRTALDSGRTLSALSPEELAAQSPLLDEEFYAVLRDGAWLESKVSEGGTALGRVREQLVRARAALA